MRTIVWLRAGYSPSPRAGVSTAIRVAKAQSVCANQRHNLTVVESHAIENVADVDSVLNCEDGDRPNVAKD